MMRYKLTIEYDGTKYVGWQRQKNGPSIQEEIEKAISNLTGKFSEVVGAGRTDSGVHALGQVAHFDTDKDFKIDTIRDGLNKYLYPQPIAILKAYKMKNFFHARFSAKQRYYLYKIVNRRSYLTLEKNKVWILHKQLDFSLMNQAAKYFLGKHNLNAFRSINCQSKSSVKTIDYINVSKKSDRIMIGVKAKSFLHSQVRIMVGTLVSVGKGQILPGQLKLIIKNQNRKDAGPTAPPEGLYLKSVKY